MLQEGENPAGRSHRACPNAPCPVHAPFFAALENLYAQRPRSVTKLSNVCTKGPCLRYCDNVSLIETLSGETTRYFNHYGTAGTILHIPYHSLLLPHDGNAKPDLHGKVVLVGFDDDFQSDNTGNTFFSPFRQSVRWNWLRLPLPTCLTIMTSSRYSTAGGSLPWLMSWGSLLGWLSTKKLRVGLIFDTAVGNRVFSQRLLAVSWLFAMASVDAAVVLDHPIGDVCLFG